MVDVWATVAVTIMTVPGRARKASTASVVHKVVGICRCLAQLFSDHDISVPYTVYPFKELGT